MNDTSAPRHVGTRILWCAVYAVAMAFVEAAVVVYLRALGPGDGPLAALQSVLPRPILAVEVAREAATIVMLFAVAVVAGQRPWQRFLYFALMFGVWDIFYYVWLWVLIGWPSSLLTWDVLFLIPVPWVAPVLAPVIVSICLVLSAARMLLRGTGPLPLRAWAVAIAGAALVLLSFVLDARVALVSGEPPAFRWLLFGAGVAAGCLALGTAGRRPPPPIEESA